MAVLKVSHGTWESVEKRMTLVDLLSGLVKRWPIVLVAIGLSVLAALLLARTEPVYRARTEVVFLAPTSARYPNELVTQTESLIVTAGAVAKRINGADTELKFGSPLVNPVGAPSTGKSTWISLLDIGTQWVPVFDDQILVVDAVGSSPDEVRRRIDAAADRIQTELRELQQEMKVEPADYITTRMSPVAPVVLEVTGSKTRAAGMTLLIGAFLTVTLVVVLEVRTRRAPASVPVGIRPRTAAPSSGAL